MQESVFDFWCKPDSEQNEDNMEKSHRRGWELFIDELPADLSGKRVLDFGCNQGGFLRLLYSKKPFLQGVGVDLATKAIAIADSRKGDLPLKYINTGRPDKIGEQFDLCISTSVLFFIADFAEHAAIIRGALTDGGEYYAGFLDVNGTSMLPVWHNYLLSSGASVPFRIHSLEDIASGFLANGFDVAVKRPAPPGFLPLEESHTGGTVAQDIKGLVELFYDRAYIFRFRKKISQ